MARDALTIYTLGVEGAQYSGDITEIDMVAANDIEFTNEGNTFIIINNAGAGSQTATFVRAKCPRCGISTAGNMDVAVTNARLAVVGPFTKDLWNQSDGTVHIDSADEDNFSFSAVKMSPIQTKW